MNGRRIEKIAFIAAPGTGATTVLALNGLTVTASCAGGSLAVTASTGVSNAVIHSGGTFVADMAFERVDEDFDAGESHDVLDLKTPPLQGTLTYVRADGELVTVTFMAEEVAAGCVFAGTATG